MYEKTEPLVGKVILLQLKAMTSDLWWIFL